MGKDAYALTTGFFFFTLFARVPVAVCAVECGCGPGTFLAYKRGNLSLCCRCTCEGVRAHTQSARARERASERERRTRIYPNP